MILITGCSGLVGQAVARLLLQEKQPVRAIKRANSDLSLLRDIEPQIEWIEGDVLDILSLERAMEGVDYVVHAAAIVSFAPSERAAMYAANATGTANVVNACLQAKVKKIAFVSSIAALGRPAPNGQPTGTLVINENQKWEDSPLNSHYAKSKYLAELEVWRGVAEGLPAVVVNPSIILGEGNWNRSSTQLFKYVYDQKPFYTEGFVNYVDLQDVAKAVVTLLFSDIKNERFVLSAGHTTYRQLFEEMAKGFGKKAPDWRISPALIPLLWRIEALRSWLTGKAPLITRETAKTARSRVVFDASKIQKQLNFKFNSLENTVARVCKNLQSLD
jgi:dihydroflavonol-4-reductase